MALASGDLLVISWGGTFGAVRSGVTKALENGRSVAHAHIQYLNPFPKNLDAILKRYKQVVVAEINGGQLAFLLRGTYALDIQSFSKMAARPFKIVEISEKIEELLG